MPTGLRSRAEPDLAVEIATLELANPVMPASGTYDWKPDDGHPLHPDELGAVVTKSITLTSRQGNPPHRIHEVAGAVLNSIGIPSLGFDAYKTSFLQAAERLRTRVITSIAGFSAAEFAELCRRLDDEPRVDAIELNLSCPNIETDSIFATDPRQMADIIEACRGATTKPLIAKLSPSVPDIAPFVRTAQEAGSDAACVANTFTGMVIDPQRRHPVLGNTRGGVTGPALLPIILHHVWTAAAASRMPIVASGGIYSGTDALQYLLAGASAVQVGTASFREPLALRRILAELVAALGEAGFASARDAIGGAQPGRTAEAHHA